MRLTLRTLLAYLDDTLEPAQAKLIGQKVAESDTAQELIARIKQVTRRRRITTPPPSGPGSKIDANTIAEYLDNAVSAEQLAEVEQICLASDVHLAEVAACHQILTLVLGEPALVPPTARQRMYGLVKGPEAIPFRKPPVRAVPDREIIVENKETDETLRLGLPAYRRKGSWSHRLLLVGGGLLVACLLVFAIIQVMQPLQGGKDRSRGSALAQNDSKDKEQPEKPGRTEDKDGQPSSKKAAPEPEKKGDVQKPEKQPETKQPDEPVDKKGVEPGRKPLLDVPYQAASTKQVSGLAFYVPPTTNEKSILLQAQADRAVWKRLGVKYPDVKTGRRLVSLPGSRSEIESPKSGVQLTLWGFLPELYPIPPVLESVVELHDNNQKGLDLDMTFYRGRIVLINSRREGPARVRLRYENPTVPGSTRDADEGNKKSEAAVSTDFMDIILMDRGSKVLLERWSLFKPAEKFFRDPEDPNRLGPIAEMGIVGLAGDVILKANDLEFALESRMGQGPPVAAWSSQGKGLTGPHRMEKLPVWVSTNPPVPPLPQGTDPKEVEKYTDRMIRMRSDMLHALDDVSTAMSDKTVGVALREAVTSPDSARRRYAVRCFAALDDFENLVEALDQDSKADVRYEAITSLQMWIASSRDVEYRLYDYLKKKYKASEAFMIMDLLHPYCYSAEARSEPGTYEALIKNLNNDLMVIRELSNRHLNTLVNPKALGRPPIPYDAVGPPAFRREAQERWESLIPRGKLPPQPAGK